MLLDKLNITPVDEDINNAIRDSRIVVSLPEEHKDYKKHILSNVLEHFKKNDTLENAVEKYLAIRNGSNVETAPPPPPPVPVPPPVSTVSTVSTDNGLSLPNRENAPTLSSPSTFKTHLVSMVYNDEAVNLPTNSRCFVHCVVSRKLDVSVITLVISNKSVKHVYHMYKENDVFLTISNPEYIRVPSNNEYMITVNNYKNNKVKFRYEVVKLDQIQRIDKNHYRLSLNNIEYNEHDVMIGEYVFYHVEDDKYITDSVIKDMSVFINADCTILSNIVNIIFKYYQI